ncbi:MAG: hypothetical protein C0518_15495 [Opitutus sp.]|nr:hypothetical protein [Opitutus sp.]
MSKRRRLDPALRGKRAAPVSAPPAKWLMWIVVATCVVVIVLLMRLARDILAQLQSLGGTGGASSTRLLTGLFVAMLLAGFTIAALWAALKRALGRDGQGE